MTMKELSVVVVAGGSGRRMGTELPKQYLMLKDHPIIIWTLLNIYEATQGWVDSELILVRPSGDQAYVEELLRSYLPSSIPVSYTHLDVYKRQCYNSLFLCVTPIYR